MGSRRAIVGLGNPGARYAATRHNIGFVVVDAVGGALGSSREESGFGALWSRAEDPAGEVLLAKPQRYMNRSGGPVAALMEEWRLEAGDVLVIHDDVDLDLGRLKLKRGGGAGGHRGLLSIEESIGTRDFVRLRFGVGRPRASGDTADHVLEAFAAEEQPVVEGAVARACAGVLDWLRLDFQAAMKKVNTAPEKPVESAGSGC